MTRSTLRRVALAAAATIAAGAGLTLATAGPAGAAETAQVSVVHGIPGQPVDVYVNGKKTLSNFQPATVAGPLSLSAGSYDVALTKPGQPASAAILAKQGLAVPAGKNLSLVANLDAAGKPALNAFVNDTSPIAAGKSRLVVRHTAAAPAVDVRAGGKPVFTDLTNPKEAMADIPAGTVTADVVLAGTDTVVLGPTTLNLAAGSETIIYAIGSSQDKTLKLVAQSVTGLGAAPAGMPAGTGGQAAAGLAGWWYAVLALGVALLLGGGALAARPAVARRR